MAGKPLVDDDDLIVELEDDAPGFKLPDADEEVADFKQPEIESSTLPDEIEDENEAELEDGEEPELMALLATDICISIDEVVKALA